MFNPANPVLLRKWHWLKVGCRTSKPRKIPAPAGPNSGSTSHGTLEQTQNWIKPGARPTPLHRKTAFTVGSLIEKRKTGLNHHGNQDINGCEEGMSTIALHKVTRRYTRL